MSMTFFLRGLIIGLSIAAIVGPIAILCIQRTLQRGFRYGFVTGLGAASADALYGSVAAFGLTVITSFLVSQQMWIHLLGGLFLIYLGIKTVRQKPAEKAAQATSNGFVSAYTSTLLLTLTNPQTILAFLAIFAGLGLSSSARSVVDVNSLLVVGGVFLGSALWWLVLSSGVYLLRARFTATWLLWVTRLSGVILLLFGLYALWSIIHIM